MDEPRTGYRMTRDNAGPWMFCGTTADEVIEAIRVELLTDFEENNHSTIQLEPIQITQQEIDNMPEFPGW